MRSIKRAQEAQLRLSIFMNALITVMFVNIRTINTATATTVMPRYIIYLYQKSCKPNDEENRIAKDATKNVSLPVNLASIDLIKQRHHYKSVEDHREMLRWPSSQHCT
jgi:hypothetical protein